MGEYLHITKKNSASLYVLSFVKEGPNWISTYLLTLLSGVRNFSFTEVLQKVWPQINVKIKQLYMINLHVVVAMQRVQRKLILQSILQFMANTMAQIWGL